jgi:hypothetical protein
MGAVNAGHPTAVAAGGVRLSGNSCAKSGAPITAPQQRSVARLTAAP